MSQGGSSGRVATVRPAFELTVSVVAYAGDLETLEGGAIVPMVHSVFPSAAEE